MTIKAIHQFVHSFVPMDAIGTHVLNLRQLLQEFDMDSEIYCLESRGSHSEIAKEYTSYRSTDPTETAVIYHSSTGSPVADFVAKLDDYKIVNYHNITPPKFFFPWEPHVGVELTRGLQQLEELAPLVELGIGDSSFNTFEMTQIGYKKAVVAPVMSNVKACPQNLETTRKTQRAAGDKANSLGSHWLFVGRIAPNKSQHDIIKAFYIYRKLFDPLAKLSLVGGSSSHVYWRALHRFVAKLDLGSSVNITGSISDIELENYYQTADIFVCLSQHEGFCVPLVEAMDHKIPIVSLESSALGETLLNAGLLLKDNDPVIVASAANRVRMDANLRNALIGAGQIRVEELSLDSAREKYRKIIASFIDDHNSHNASLSKSLSK